MSEALQTYFNRVGKYPLLTREQEVSLAKKIESGDRHAKDMMIQSNLRLAISIAKKYYGKGCSLEDLIQESNMGLIKAVDRFDWRKGFKFSTYAYWWIKQSVRTHVASQGSDIKLPAHTRNLLWKMNETIREYEDEFDQKPSFDEVASALGIPINTLMSMIKCSSQMSLDANIKDRSGGAGRKIAEVIPDERSNNIEDLLDSVKIKGVMRKALRTLTSREENIIRLRFGIGEVSNDLKSNFNLTPDELSKVQERTL
jgi:RNA polymerase primary sigma factor